MDQRVVQPPDPKLEEELYLMNEVENFITLIEDNHRKIVFVEIKDNILEITTKDKDRKYYDLSKVTSVKVLQVRQNVTDFALNMIHADPLVLSAPHTVAKIWIKELYNRKVYPPNAREGDDDWELVHSSLMTKSYKSDRKNEPLTNDLLPPSFGKETQQNNWPIEERFAEQEHLLKQILFQLKNQGSGPTNEELKNQKEKLLLFIILLLIIIVVLVVM
eukprot:TRINITY_DN3792_c0_g1_i1.p1 TRINITY_DN3792_c0_g1~~TRINITY_DN3792_c0_g1_i1.p1  ORF type:complete len:218 (-),score=37.86 TRINITY_DN3792_c0_g1_i1:23-676(-)